MTAEANAPDPPAQPCRSANLLGLVRKRSTMAANSRPPSASAPSPTGPRHYLLRYRRCRADPRTHRPRPAPRRRARSEAHPQRGPPGRGTPRRLPEKHRAPRQATAPSADETNTRLTHLPTPEQIAAKVRRQPIGAVFADICRDLGILPSHPLWRELQIVIIREDGNLANLVKDILDQAFPITPPPPPGSPAPPPRFLAPARTGPP